MADNLLIRFARNLSKTPRFTLMRSIARFPLLRKVGVLVTGKFGAGTSGYRKNDSNTIFPELDVDQAIVGLKRDGFYTGLRLPKDALYEIVDTVTHLNCYADRNPLLGFGPRKRHDAERILGREIAIAQCFNVSQHCARIRDLEVDSKLLAIAAIYLNAKPKCLGTNVWWSFPINANDSQRDDAAQLFHYDLDDFAFIKFFFYLNNVDEDNGPHVCVAGSHRKKRFKSFGDRFLARRYTDDEIIELYGRNSIKQITGNAGEGFAEDTLCIHKGITPIKRERLLLQVQFAINDYGLQSDVIEPSMLKLLVH
jgi:hypothetical protein